MTDLRPCSGCRRHVSIDEHVCPFCAATLTAAVPHQARLGRLSRAAVFAGAAALSVSCGGKKKPDTTTTDPTTAQSDAGVIEEGPSEQKEPEKAPVPMPYGAPPARRRVV